jgi:hypothetical protein
MVKCDRCGREGVSLTGSWFNTEMICCGDADSCAAKEKAHPQFAEAKRVEEEAVKRGDMNFPGIGYS